MTPRRRLTEDPKEFRADTFADFILTPIIDLRRAFPIRGQTPEAAMPAMISSSVLATQRPHPPLAPREHAIARPHHRFAAHPSQGAAYGRPRRGEP